MEINLSYLDLTSSAQEATTKKRAPRRGVVSRSTLIHIGLLFLPLAFFVLTAGLVEYSMLAVHTSRPLGEILRWNAPPVLLTLLIPCFSVALAHSRWPKLAPTILVGGGTLLTAGLFFLATLVVPVWYAEWFSLATLNFVRDDALVLLTFASVSLSVLETAQGGWRRLYLIVLHLAVPFLAWLPLIELAYLMKTGSMGGWGLFVHFARHASELVAVFGDTISVGEVLMLLGLPLLVTLLPFTVKRLPPLQQWMQRGRARRGAPWLAPARLLPIFLLFALLPASRTHKGRRVRSYMSFFQGVSSAVFPNTPSSEATPAKRVFNTNKLQLSLTDSTRRMNVVFVVLESMRSRSTTPYGAPVNTTPFLDSLAQRSLLVEDMHAVVSYTNKQLTAIFAGVFPNPVMEVTEARVGGLPARGLPRLLSTQGYRTGFFTPVKLDFENKGQLLHNLGFQDVRGPKSMQGRGFITTNTFGLEDRATFAPSLDWVDKQMADDQPFFLSYLTLTSHHPYRVPPGFKDTVHTSTKNKHLQDYYNALRYTDGFVRDLMAAFKERGLLRSTLFVFVGDHGEAFGEHGQRIHGDIIWDEALEVPALLYSPRLFPEGGRIEGSRQHIDFLPTIADALNMKLSGGRYPGRSLLKPNPPGRATYHHTWNGRKALALRRDSLKFIYRYGRRPMQVFNVKRDPHETHDIADQISPRKLNAAEAELTLWHQGVKRIYQCR